ncbi:phospholipase D-like domain-containing protein [Helicobacter sp. T3_23-1056]
MNKLLANFVLFFGFSCFACIAFSSLSMARSELYMMPYEQAQALKSLQGALKRAQKTIDISIYNFTNREIAKTLRDSANRGVKIRIIYDKDSSKDARSTIGYLEKYNNISTCTLKGRKAQNGNYYGIMHQKMAIIDKNLLYIGSANWSKNAFENNFETLFYDDDSYLVNKALNAFEQMIKECEKF